MIRQVTEGGITWLPGLSLSDIPHPLPKGIHIHIRREEIGLEIQGLVGAIPLLNGDTIQIIPKIGRVNFLRLLFKAEGFQRDLDREFDDFVKYSVEDDQNIASFVACQLMVSADEIIKRSPKQGRVKRRREGLFAIGQLDAMATALNIASHKSEPIVYYAKERTPDIPENRVITEAILRGWLMLDETERDRFRSIREKWLGRFARAKKLWADLEHVEQGFASARYGGPRDYYRKALMLSQIVLGSNGLGFNEAATIEGDSVLLRADDIFEKYLRNVISGAYSEDGYVVTKGGTSVTTLYTDGSHKLEPDIVISREGHIQLIIDSKYKAVTNDDHCQMHTYLTIFGVKRGLLLAPLVYGDKEDIREYSTVDNTVIREVYLPMSNLTVTEDLLSKVIEKFA